MKYQKRIVCYFDVLGFSNLVENNKISAETIGQLFSELNVLLQGYNAGGNIRMDQFSDSFVISIQTTRSSPEQIRVILEVLSKLLEFSLIVRGSLVYGELIHEDGRIYGPALVKAVRLEKCLARYPRIILDDSLNSLILQTVGNAPINYASYFTNFFHVKRDEDGKPYIDYINYLRNRKQNRHSWESLLSLIREGVKIEHPGTREKYEWLEKKIGPES